MKGIYSGAHTHADKLTHTYVHASGLGRALEAELTLKQTILYGK